VCWDPAFFGPLQDGAMRHAKVSRGFAAGHPWRISGCFAHNAFNQLDSFLPPCPITFRMRIVPAGYKGQREADSSHPILDDQAAFVGASPLKIRGLRGCQLFNNKAMMH
jgi:hypothetical protein